ETVYCASVCLLLRTYSFLVFFFFFFQAEDGIRDGHVTGVQTCALPIFDSRGGGRHRENRRAGARQRGAERAGRARRRGHRVVARSEERRVGKEGRSRGVPYH